MLLNPLCYTAKFIAIHWILPNSFKNVKEACIPQGRNWKCKSKEARVSVQKFEIIISLIFIDFRHFIAVTLAVNIIIRSTGALYGM